MGWGKLGPQETFSIISLRYSIGTTCAYYMRTALRARPGTLGSPQKPQLPPSKFNPGKEKQKTFSFPLKLTSELVPQIPHHQFSPKLNLNVEI
jgi:hypothetical protein